jgi:hypothetical protein
MVLSEQNLEQGEQTLFFPLSAFASGVYSIEILTNGTRQTARIQLLR